MEAVNELALSPDLQAVLLCTETACVRECCGIDAFEPDVTPICQWAHEVGSRRAGAVLEELRRLALATEDRSVVISSMFINACTPDEPARQKLLRFLNQYVAALGACV